MRVARTVVLLGIVSLLTDVSSESVSAVLPLYLTTVLGLSPLAYGAVDSLYQGVSTLVRITGGVLADRSARPKWVAFAGYAVSAVSRAALLPAQGLAVVSAAVTADRLGKGLRTAPRDALISAVSPPEGLGRAFGVHRALDTAGAMLGPLVAFVVLTAVPGDVKAVFVVATAVGLAGLAVLGLLVPDTRTGDAAAGPAAAGPAPGTTRALLLDARLRGLLLLAGVLGLLTVGDGFLYLALQHRDGLALRWFPLLMVGTNLVYMVLAVPLGRLADRVGRGRVLALGHLALAGACACAGGPLAGPAATVGCLALLGSFYAATDGVLPALTSRLVPAAVRGRAIAAAQTVVAGARALSSLAFGALWTALGQGSALLLFAVALTAVVPVALRQLRRLDHAQ